MISELESLVTPLEQASRVVCFDSPQQYTLVGKFKESKSVYLAIDDRTVTVAGDPIQGEVEAERELLARVDHVVCVSNTLARTLRERAGNRSDLPIDVLTNGYDERVFIPEGKWEEPAELSNIPHPRMLVSGHISERIDWDGIRKAAELRPSWSWIFVGPSDHGIEDRIASIRANGEIMARQFRPVPYENVPAWIAHCDACAVPYRLNDFTLASSPLKAIEYLATGAPVLSTRIPSIEQFGEFITWVEEADGLSYAYALDELLRQERFGPSAQRRWQAVTGESWVHKTQQFTKLLDCA